MRLTLPALRLALFALVLGVTLVAVPTASALTVSRNGNVIEINAAAGEANDVNVLEAGGNVRVTENNVGQGPTVITPGPGCANSIAKSVDCGAANTVTQTTANLGDMDDEFNPNLGATTAPNVVDLGPGQDSSGGHLGSDTINGGTGNDNINGEAGNDTVDGGVGNDIISDGAGDDTLNGGEGNDNLDDSTGNNALSGGEGDDSLIPGSGTDSMDGGPGNDNLSPQTRSSLGPDVYDGGPGYDNASFFGTGEPLVLSLDLTANDGSEGQGMNLLNLENLSGGSANDTLIGGPGPELLFGNAGADALTGGGGNDELQGGSQNDALAGGDGNDALYAHSGDDALDGGTGNDLLYGYDGADNLVGGDGRDTVDFGGGNQYRGVSVTLDDAANDGAEGEGDNAHSDNENIIGSGGPDLLIGGPGVNVISGGDSYDTILVREGGPAVAARDTVLCGDDEDTVTADPTDQIGAGAEHCENVSYGDVTGYGPVIGITATGKGAGQSGILPLLLRCPLKARGGCEGVATLRVGGRRAGRVRFSMRPGQEIDRDMTLSKRARRAINKSRRGVRGTLTVDSADEIGATARATKNVRLTK